MNGKQIDYNKLAFLDEGCVCSGDPYKLNEYTNLTNPFTLSKFLKSAGERVSDLSMAELENFKAR